ncbi:alginate O-acetyltransferase AlgX-related protein [Bizionia myxarmorum]|nr:hypothetical protein [Bizionia myxarmorum]
MFFNLESSENNENREFTSFPVFSLKNPISFLKEFNTYYSENFGLKTTLVNNYIDFKFQVLDETPMPTKVVKGLEGWYFLGNSYNNTFDNAFGNNNFKTSQLEEIARRLLEIKSYLKSQNIEFYLVVPPNKSTIYKEYLPFQLNKNESNLEALKNHLKTEANFEIIDLTKTLLAKKNKELVYLKTDSHWNEYGAFLGYKETMRIINQDFIIASKELTDYNLIMKVRRQGDIVKMINLSEEESALTFTKKHVNQEAKVQRDIKLFMYFDSFSYAWMPYFNESFANIEYLNYHSISKQHLANEKPDIIIFEIVERNIDILLKNENLLVY